MAKKINFKNLFKTKMLVSAGNTFPNWIRVLIDNRFKISLRYIPRALLITVVTLLLYPFVILEKIIFGKKIKNTAVKKPVFIVGHMRSGTTFLHYLMCQDPQYTYVKTSEAIFPSIFLTLRWIVHFLMMITLPKKRPMDNIKIGIEQPQEEELGMANLCPYSPNNGSYFPKNLVKAYTRYSLFEGVKEQVIQRWSKTYLYFLKKITYRSGGKPIVSKNLVNSGRIKQLTGLFPDAKYIHIYRNPYKVFLSTKKLYKKFIFEHMIFHRISDQELEDTILRLAKIGFKEYFKKRQLIPRGDLVEIQFEDLVKNPLPNMEKIYKELNLENYQQAKIYMEKIVKDYVNYKQDEYQIDQKLKEKIYHELKFVFDEYGYSA